MGRSRELTHQFRHRFLLVRTYSQKEVKLLELRFWGNWRIGAAGIIAISTVPCRIQTTRRILATQPEWKPKASNLQSQRSLKSQSRGKAVKQVHYLLAIRTATRKSPAARERSRQQLLRPLPSRGLKGISILELCTKPLHCVSEVFHLLLLWTLDCIIRANICLFGRSLGLLSTLFPGHLRKVWKREGFF